MPDPLPPSNPINLAAVREAQSAQSQTKTADDIAGLLKTLFTRNARQELRSVAVVAVARDGSLLTEIVREDTIIYMLGALLTAQSHLISALNPVSPPPSSTPGDAA